MFERLLCFIRRRHEYRFRSENGLAFLMCEHCGFRSSGWETGPAPIPTPSAPSLRLLLGDPSEVTPNTPLVTPPADTSRGQRMADKSRDFRLLFDA